MLLPTARVPFYGWPAAADWIYPNARVYNKFSATKIRAASASATASIMTVTGAVAAGHELTAQAAELLLRDGGNAFDAAIGAFFMACIAEPVLASPGGGGFVMAHAAGRNDTVAFDFFTQTPGSQRPEAELDFEPVVVDFGSATQEFHMGVGSSAVPGCIRGLFALHRQLGSMPMRSIVQPALDAARSGITVTPLQAHVFSLVAPIYITRPAPRGVFQSSSQPGQIAQAGDVIQFTELANTLEAIALEGDDLFYRGEIAHRIDTQCRGHGGCITRADLEGYEMALRRPLAIDYRDARVFTNPPPAAGGCFVGFALKLLEPYPLSPLRFGSVGHLTTLARCLAVADNARRQESTGATGLDPLDAPMLSRYREQVHGRTQVQRGTTHLNVMDRHGNVAAMTVTNGEGCGDFVPGTGIMLNNMLGEEDLNPGGFHSWTPNQRMSSMMAPTLIRRADGRIVATGSGGSSRIRDAILQVVVNIVDFDMDVEQAVTSPRIHVDNGALYVEGGYDLGPLAPLLAEFSEHRVWQELNFFFGGAHTLSGEATGMHGAGDPRRGGVCRIVR